jgi:hypothetical protein
MERPKFVPRSRDIADEDNGDITGGTQYRHRREQRHEASEHLGTETIGMKKGFERDIHEEGENGHSAASLMRE